MRKGIFSKLAVQNIRNNKSTYIPYMITCIFCIAMIYMMEFLRDCPTLDRAVRHAAEVRMILSTGEVVVVIFCVIFLIYSNSFLMKRRQKEIGLYNILGLERNHIGIVLLLETIFTTILSLTGGIAIGILASKLSLLLLLRLLHIPAVLGFYISTKGIITCLLMFGAIFLLILLLNLRRIHLSRPVELLRGNNTGEREPKAKWLMALLGFICLGIGYYLAITTESPIKAITIFLLAVILVMAGTYLLFTAGSIVILKFLRRRKSFYYKTGNFISISGMLYRMKQNAVGLASICILSTGVLLMISMTVSIYFGMNDIMVNRYPYDTDISITGVGEEECQTAIETFEKAIEQSQIIMFPGGFSAGDEPDGSAKFFATAFQNAKMKEAVEKLLNERDGLALGICNGFQALIKLGLVPNGEITGQKPDSPTLTYNTIGRHISKMVYTKVVTNKSPWLAEAKLGGVYTNPASHGEGRFVASKEWLDKLFANGQVATQYCDPEGNITMNEEWNVNGSYCAIEGITSPDGRVLGKMAHSERRNRSVAMNIYGEQDLKIFESGVKYFK